MRISQTYLWFNQTFDEHLTETHTFHELSKITTETNYLIISIIILLKIFVKIKINLIETDGFLMISGGIEVNQSL